MTKAININDTKSVVEEFGKYSWIKPALVMGSIGFLTYAVFLSSPYLLEAVQELFLFLMFFGMLS